MTSTNGRRQLRGRSCSVSCLSNVGFGLFFFCTSVYISFCTYISIYLFLGPYFTLPTIGMLVYLFLITSVAIFYHSVCLPLQVFLSIWVPLLFISFSLLLKLNVSFCIEKYYWLLIVSLSVKDSKLVQAAEVAQWQQKLLVETPTATIVAFITVTSAHGHSPHPTTFSSPT